MQGTCRCKLIWFHHNDHHVLLNDFVDLFGVYVEYADKRTILGEFLRKVFFAIEDLVITKGTLNEGFMSSTFFQHDLHDMQTLSSGVCYNSTKQIELN